ncbi:MAG: sigma-70 family RNA polymerase sigma factor [Acidobacteriota bacterium]
MEAIRRMAVLSREEEAVLCDRARRGDEEAAQCLVAANLGRVAAVARGFRGRGLPLDDLIAEGTVGLLAALPHFDPSRGVRFFTYACFHVRRRIVQALAQGLRTVRLPRQAIAKRREFEQRRRDLSNLAGERVGRAEAAQSLGVDPDIAHDAWLAPTELSTDEEVAPGEGLRGDQLPAADGSRPDRQFDESEAMVELEKALTTLPPRDREILQARFGLGSKEGEGQTLRELSADMNLTKERIRQLEERAKERLRCWLQGRQRPARRVSVAPVVH